MIIDEIVNSVNFQQFMYPLYVLLTASTGASLGPLLSLDCFHWQESSLSQQ